MSSEGSFFVDLEHLDGFEFRVHFDREGMGEILMDEPEPLGGEKGPNAARTLAAAVGNCLTASLLFCLRKVRVAPEDVNTRVDGHLVRNDQGRLRVGKLAVTIALKVENQPLERAGRCLQVFEDYCVVTESVRQGIPVSVTVEINNDTVYESG